MYLRLFLMKHYKGNDSYYALMTIPVSIKYEIFVIKFAKLFLINMLKQYKTDLKQDYENILNSQLDC